MKLVVGAHGRLGSAIRASLGANDTIAPARPIYESWWQPDSEAAIDECIHQYVFDAIAEFRVSKILGKKNPDSDRLLKDARIRPRATGVDNKEAADREKAANDLSADDLDI